MCRNTSHSMENALSLTLAGFTWSYIYRSRKNGGAILTTPILTLGSFVRPLIGHSLTSGGVSIEQTFAFATHASLMMLTVNCLVALIFREVSLFVKPLLGWLLTETETTGG